MSVCIDVYLCVCLCLSASCFTQVALAAYVFCEYYVACFPVYDCQFPMGMFVVHNAWEKAGAETKFDRLRDRPTALAP